MSDVCGVSLKCKGRELQGVVLGSGGKGVSGGVWF